jgi:hypothetical protein
MPRTVSSPTPRAGIASSTPEGSGATAGSSGAIGGIAVAASSTRRRFRMRMRKNPPTRATRPTIGRIGGPPEDPAGPDPLPAVGPPAAAGASDADGSGDGAGDASSSPGVGPEPPDVPPAGTAVGRGVDAPLASVVGRAVGFGVGLGLGAPIGVAVGTGVDVVVGPGVGFGVGFGVGVAVGAGVGVGFGVGVGIGVGVGSGVGDGAVTVTRAGVTLPALQLVPPPLIAWKVYGHNPTGSCPVPEKTTPLAQVDPAGFMSLVTPCTVRRTQAGAVPLLSETVTWKVNVVDVVPLPGETVPLLTEIVPHVRASTGVARPVRDSVSQLVSAMAPTSHIRIRCKGVLGKPELQSDFEHTKPAGMCP